MEQSFSAPIDLRNPLRVAHRNLSADGGSTSRVDAIVKAPQPSPPALSFQQPQALIVFGRRSGAHQKTDAVVLDFQANALGVAEFARLPDGSGMLSDVG